MAFGHFLNTENYYLFDKMKIVLFTQRVEVIESYNERRDCADQRIAEFIRACGYLPVPVPNNAALAKEMVEELKPAGIILTGGNSLEKWGGNAPERDATDKAYIELAVDKNIPLYGFCRGMQSILDFFGEELTTVTGHVAKRMNVTGVEDPVLGSFNREVNSYHNQGCVAINRPDIEILAKSEDGVIKAIRLKAYNLLGTMWHPEREAIFSQDDIKMVQNHIG